MLSQALSNAVSQHKNIAKEFIYSSEISITINTKAVQPTSTGSPMFANLGEDLQLEPFGPFKCIWLDADSARASQSARESAIVGRFPEATIVAKFWLEDVLVDTTKSYGENYFDRADHLVSDGKRYEILGYDRYGLGTTYPYLISVAIRGSFTSNE